MLRAFRSLCWTVFLLLFCGTPLLAQSKAQVADSLKKVVADHRSMLYVADAIGNSKAAMEIRSQLALLVKPKEAMALLQEAVAIADSADLMEEEVAARTQLAEYYESRGDHKAAYAEAMRIVALDNERLAAQAEGSATAADMRSASSAAERDSLQLIWNEAVTNARTLGHTAEERSDRWMWIAAGIGVFSLFTLLVTFHRSGRSNRLIRSELDGLRAEVTTLKEERPANQVRTVPPAIVAPLPPVQVPVTAPVVEPTLAAEIDPVVLAMFQKMAPERLTTLRDARARGDGAKVMRVVHSLKPQLVNFDAAFADLCARITAAEAPENMVLWAADLDALESGIATVLKKLDH